MVSGGLVDPLGAKFAAPLFCTAPLLSMKAEFSCHSDPPNRVAFFHFDITGIPISNPPLNNFAANKIQR